MEGREGLDKRDRLERSEGLPDVGFIACNGAMVSRGLLDDDTFAGDTCLGSMDSKMVKQVDCLELPSP